MVVRLYGLVPHHLMSDMRLNRYSLDKFFCLDYHSDDFVGGDELSGNHSVILA